MSAIGRMMAVAAGLLVIEPVAGWGPWWRVGLVVALVIAWAVLELFGEVRRQVSHG